MSVPLKAQRGTTVMLVPLVQILLGASTAHVILDTEAMELIVTVRVIKLNHVTSA